MLRYIGNGYIPGIPARDLSEEEIKRLPLNRAALVESGLYFDRVPVKIDLAAPMPKQHRKRGGK